MDDNRITYFAQTDARNKRVKFGIKAKDRTRHVYVIGKTGMGKSTMLENMAVQDIQNGEGMCFIDPHGKTADLMLEYVPKERIKDVIYIAPFDIEHPISFNVLEQVDPDKRHLVSSGLMSTFKKIWEDAWSARMEYILTNTLLALLEYPGATLLGVNRMLSDKEYRKEVVNNIKDPSVKAFWQKEFANYTERQAAEAVPAIQNKVGQFTANPLIRNMIGQSKSSFDFREAIDRKKIVIINLSKGRIGDENMKLLGGLLVTKIYLAAMSRADVPDRTMQMLPNFYLYVDEFQNFANASFADILSEARKYKLNLTIAHQYIEQMDEIVRPAVFGNVGTMIAFRVGATDAEVMEKEFAPQFVIEDLVNLGFTQIYLKLMIDGLSSAPFSATTLPPIPHPDSSFVKEIIASSREQFARPRAEVEEAVVKFHNPVVASKTNAAATKTPIAVAKTENLIVSPPTSTPVQSPSPKPAISNATNIAKPAPTAPATHKPFAAVLSKVMKKPATSSAPISPAPVVQPVTVIQLAPVAHPPVTQPASTVVSPPIADKSPVPIQSAPTAVQSIVESPTVIVKQPTTIKPPMTPPSLQRSYEGQGNNQLPTSTSKPVSLSNLAPKPVSQNGQRVDPKVPTKQNVSDLKNALAAVLRKGNQKTAVAVQETVKPVQSGVAKPSQNSPKKPEEVPEDVLKRVLNVD